MMYQTFTICKHKPRLLLMWAGPVVVPTVCVSVLGPLLLQQEEELDEEESEDEEAWRPAGPAQLLSVSSGRRPIRRGRSSSSCTCSLEAAVENRTGGSPQRHLRPRQGRPVRNVKKLSDRRRRDEPEGGGGGGHRHRYHRCR